MEVIAEIVTFLMAFGVMVATIFAFLCVMGTHSRVISLEQRAMNAHDYAEAHIAFHKLPEELHAEVRLLVIRAYRDGRRDGCDDGTRRAREIFDDLSALNGTPGEGNGK